MKSALKYAIGVWTRMCQIGMTGFSTLTLYVLMDSYSHGIKYVRISWGPLGEIPFEFVLVALPALALSMYELCRYATAPLRRPLRLVMRN